MPKCCSVFKCKATSESTPDRRSFHLYPEDPTLRSAWVKRVRRENFEPGAYSYICSYHFGEKDFRRPNVETPAQFRRSALKLGAIPKYNLRGEAVDERITQRNSRTSTKARSSSEDLVLGGEACRNDNNLQLVNKILQGLEDTCDLGSCDTINEETSICALKVARHSFAKILDSGFDVSN